MKKSTFRLLKKGDKRQIICFPYLGGYVSAFFELAERLPEGLEVWAANPPGHGTCTRPPLEDINSLTELYLEELSSIIKPGAIFFGHSMGGVVAYFLAQRMAGSADFVTKPAALILSACTSPDDFLHKRPSGFTNEGLVEHMLSYGGIPDEIMQEQALIDYLLPIFRADFRVLESAAELDCDPLKIPIYYLWGESDNIVTIDFISRWSRYFQNELNVIPIEKGEHMFIHNSVDLVAGHVEKINLAV